MSKLYGTWTYNWLSSFSVKLGDTKEMVEPNIDIVILGAVSIR